MKLSVVVPVYNEKSTIKKIIELVQSVAIDKEIIIVDDCSKDGTKEILQNEIRGNNIKVLFHDKNKGKGAALRTGFKHISGDIVVIQDADLEYDPNEYPLLIKPILEGKADVVYGSRFLGVHRDFMFFHYLGNKFLNLVTNLLYNTVLTDMETGYKAFRKEVIEEINLKSNGFSFEPEFTAKIFKQRYRIYEVPITYTGRTYAEGKKITWRHGFLALFTLIKYRFMD